MNIVVLQGILVAPGRAAGAAVGCHRRGLRGHHPGRGGPGQHRARHLAGWAARGRARRRRGGRRDRFGPAPLLPRRRVPPRAAPRSSLERWCRRATAGGPAVPSRPPGRPSSREAAAATLRQAGCVAAAERRRIGARHEGASRGHPPPCSATRPRACSATPPRASRRKSSRCPGPDFLDRAFVTTDRSPAVLRSLGELYGTAAWAAPATCRSSRSTRASSTPAAASFAPNPLYFDPANIVKLAIEGGCNAVATTFGVLGAVSPPVRPQDPVHRQAQPQRAAHLPEQVRPGHVRLGARGVEPRRGRRRRHHLLRSTEADAPAPGGRRGLRGGPRARHVHGAVVLPAQRRLQEGRGRLQRRGRPHRPGQPPRRHHPGRHHQAEAARPTTAGSRCSKFGKTSPLVYGELVTDHPIDLCRWQVVNCYMGRIGLINSGGESKGASDLAEAVRTAVINKRAGGQGLISGRKAFQRPDGRGHRAAPRHPGRLPRRQHHHRLTGRPSGRPARIRVRCPGKVEVIRTFGLLKGEEP